MIENIYYYQHGKLLLKPDYFNISGWPGGEPEQYSSILADCFERGGTFYGIFDNSTLVGAAILENNFIGKNKDQLQLKFLHISRSHRKQGLGKILFNKVVQKAKERGARKLYISATPSENTVNFYLNLGCVVTPKPDKELFELEPEDIHLEYTLPS